MKKLKLNKVQKKWVSLFTSGNGSITLLMFLNKIKVLSNKDFILCKNRVIDTVRTWHFINISNMRMKHDDRNDHYDRIPPKNIKPTKGRF